MKIGRKKKVREKERKKTMITEKDMSSRWPWTPKQRNNWNYKYPLADSNKEDNNIPERIGLKIQKAEEVVRKKSRYSLDTFAGECKVWIRDPSCKLWKRKVKIIEVRNHQPMDEEWIKSSQGVGPKSKFFKPYTLHRGQNSMFLNVLDLKFTNTLYIEIV